MALPSRQSFLRKFLLALLSEPVVCKSYFRRFKIKDLADFRRLSHFGGYSLYSRLINAVPVNPGDHVLDIGPWTGMECFLLAEVYHRVSVAEPDSEIARLLKSIARHYPTDDGRPASEALDIHQMGVGLRDVQSNCDLNPSLKFDARNAPNISDVLGHHFADRVFCNHVIRVIPGEPRLSALLSSLASYCSPEGVLTWADSPAELTHALLEYVTFPDDGCPLEEVCEPLPADKKPPWFPYMMTTKIKRMIAPLLPDFSLGVRTLVTRYQGIRQADYLLVAKHK